MDSSSFPSLAEQLTDIGGYGVIIYTGNNELQGALLRLCASPTPVLYTFKTYQLLLDLQRRVHGIQYQFDALAEHQDDCISRALLQTIEQLPKSDGHIRSDPFYQKLIRDFRQRMLQTIDTFQGENMKVWLVIPPINLLERPAFSIPDPKLSAEDRLKVLIKSKERKWSDILDIDPNHAQANYELGIQPPYDYEKLRIAAERDYRSRRITLGIQKELLNICTLREIDCIDLRGQEELSSRFFHDFCHPTREYGVQTIAQTLHTHILGVQ